jgi:hypothetical protein
MSDQKTGLTSTLKIVIDHFMEPPHAGFLPGEIAILICHRPQAALLRFRQ